MRLRTMQFKSASNGSASMLIWLGKQILGQKDQQERKKGEIGFSSIRGGNIPGEHTVIFHGENESIELTHRAFNREIFADGAIEAAIWLSKQKSGYYTYKDMF